MWLLRLLRYIDRYIMHAMDVIEQNNNYKIGIYI